MRRHLALAGTAGAVAVSAARTVLRTTAHQVRFPIDRPLRVVHVTDVHVGWSTPPKLLSRVQTIAAAAAPDLVVLTGDYVNTSLRHLDRVRAFVRGLPRPCLAVLGNHDHWSGAGAIVDALRDEGVIVLNNESIAIHGLFVAGLDDGRTGHADAPRALAGIDPGRTLVLSHCPSTADRIAAEGARLILSGHTHGGQVAVPIITRAVSRAVGLAYTRGWYRLGEGTELYVNAGIGHSRRGLRHGKPAMPEVALLDLRPEALDRGRSEGRGLDLGAGDPVRL